MNLNGRLSYEGNVSGSLGAELVVDVEANPSGPATQTLVKIRVGDIIYSIPTGGGGGGTSDYNRLDNKPKINNTILEGELTLSDLGIQEAIDYPSDPTKYLDGEGNFTTPPYISSYLDLSDKPQINGVVLTGNKTSDDLDLSNKAHFTELSGSVVSFQDGQELPLAKCEVDINPTQDLHGYDKPWAGGAGKNLFDEQYPNISGSLNYKPLQVGNGTFTMTSTLPPKGGNANLFFLTGNVTSGASTANNGVYLDRPRTVTSSNGYVTIAYRIVDEDRDYDPRNFKTQVESGGTATAYEPYSNICPITGESTVTVTVASTSGGSGEDYTVSLGTTYYGGNLDVTTGELEVTWGNIASYAGETLTGEWLSSLDEYSALGTPTTGAQVVYELATPQIVQLTPEKVRTIMGVNNISANTGDIDIIYINNVNDPAIEFILNNL